VGRTSFSTLVVGPRILFREGLMRILSAAGFEIAATASSIAEISTDQVSHQQSILLIVDVSFNQDTLLNEIRLFKERYPTGRAALLGDREELSDDSIVSAFRAGAHAYFASPSCEAFLKSLELVMLGETILPRQLMSLMLQPQNRRSAGIGPLEMPELPSLSEATYAPRLSVREICILRCLIAGDPNKTIARTYGIAEATVKVHVKAILRKIRVHNRTQAAIWGLSHDLETGGATNGRLDGEIMEPRQMTELLIGAVSRVTSAQSIRGAGPEAHPLNDPEI
jgi:two-component system nitrate/nitrite response regulator NarL